MVEITMLRGFLSVSLIFSSGFSFDTTSTKRIKHVSKAVSKFVLMQVTKVEFL